MKALGVTDHRYLGGFKRYRDSGMQWHDDGHAVAADDVHENAFWNADLTEAASPPRRGHPRGAAAGAGDLRRVRRLRPPRPHPGPPGRDVRRLAGGRAVLPPRPRRGPRHRQDLLGRDVGQPRCARGCATCATPATPPPSRGWTPTATCRRSWSRTTTSTAAVDGRRLRRAPRWTRCGPTPPRSRSTGRSSRSPTTRATRSGAPSSSGSPRARPAPSGPDGLETDLFAGLGVTARVTDKLGAKVAGFTVLGLVLSSWPSPGPGCTSTPGDKAPRSARSRASSIAGLAPGAAEEKLRAELGRAHRGADRRSATATAASRTHRPARGRALGSTTPASIEEAGGGSRLGLPTDLGGDHRRRRPPRGGHGRPVRGCRRPSTSSSSGIGSRPVEGTIVFRDGQAVAVLGQAGHRSSRAVRRRRCSSDASCTAGRRSCRPRRSSRRSPTTAVQRRR